MKLFHRGLELIALASQQPTMHAPGRCFSGISGRPLRVADCRHDCDKTMRWDRLSGKGQLDGQLPPLGCPGYHHPVGIERVSPSQLFPMCRQLFFASPTFLQR